MPLTITQPLLLFCLFLHISGRAKKRSPMQQTTRRCLPAVQSPVPPSLSSLQSEILLLGGKKSLAFISDRPFPLLLLAGYFSHSNRPFSASAMSRMPLRRFASAAQKAVKDPRLTYDFRPATGKDLGVIVDLCCTDFIKIEPHSRALGLTGEESKHLFEWIVAKALHYPYSLKVVEKSSGRVAAIRTLSIGNRDHNLDWEPFPLDETKLSRNIGKLASVLDGSKKHFWEIVDPTVSKVMRREISFVRAEHQRRGIARVMVDLNLIPEELRSQGIHGIVSEASSIANQTLLASSGYKCIYEPKYDWAKKIDDGTTGVKVFFKDLRL